MAHDVRRPGARDATTERAKRQTIHRASRQQPGRSRAAAQYPRSIPGRRNRMSGVPCAVTAALAAVLLVACGPSSTADDPRVTSLPDGAALLNPSTAEDVGTSPAREPVAPSGAAKSASPETTLATSTHLEPSVSPATAQQAQDEVEKLTLDYFHAREDVALGLADTEGLYPFTTTIGQERVVILNHLNPPVTHRRAGLHTNCWVPRSRTPKRSPCMSARIPPV